MHREYHRWYSPLLNRDMELLILGHAGARVLVFPTSRGRFYEWEDRGMVWALSEHLEHGWLQLYCVDSVDSESWYNYSTHPGARAYRHAQYDSYLYSEVLPLTTMNNNNPFLITAGTSFGAYHAMNFGLRHPDKVDRILALSGLFDIRGFTGGYVDENIYLNNPIQFVANEHDPHRISQLQHMDIIMATGTTDRLIDSARAMSGVLWNQGIGNALREWDGWFHDWPHWQKMVQLYMGGHD